MSPAAETQATPDGRPLSVIVVNDYPTLAGGTDAVAIAEAAGLARRGHDVTLVAGDGEPDRRLIDAGVSVRRTGQQSTLTDPRRARAAARGIWNRPAASIVAELAAQAGPRRAVVHVHGFTKVMSASVIRAAARSGLPTLLTLHDYFAVCPNGALFNYRTEEICPLTPLSARCVATNCDARAYSHKLWRVARSSVQRRFGELPSGVGDFLAPSDAAAEIVRPFLPRSVRLHVLPNPVAAVRAAPSDVAGNAAFVFVGRLERDKGPLLLARAARAAGVPAVFVGAGEQTEAIRRANPDAELTGWVEPDRVAAIVRGARAVVSASLWHETQGLSALEAAAHGVPAIVSEGTVLTEYVEDGVTGLWFRAADAGDLARKLTLLHADGGLAARMGEAADERFWSGSWDGDTHLDRLEQLYREALAR